MIETETSNNKMVEEMPDKPNNLKFKYLPGYAEFLLNNKLEEFGWTLLVISRELKIPLLRYFDAYTDEQLIEMGKVGNAQLLGAIANNEMDAYIAESLRSWKENQLPLIQGDDIVIEDISKVNFSRRKAFRDFLPYYAKSTEDNINIMEEVDRFTLAQEEVSYKTLFEMKEKKIREHNYFIEKINNTSPGIIYVFDLQEQKEVYSNHKREELLGYTDADMVTMGGNVMVNMLHPDDLPLLADHVKEFASAADGEMRTIEYRVKNKNGTFRWQRGYETVFKRTDEGVPCQIIGIAIDVTQEKEASIQLAAREQQLREAQELARMGSFDWDMQGKDSVLSPQLIEIFELERGGDLMGFLEHVHPGDRKYVREAIEDAIAKNKEYEIEYRYRKSGTEKVIWARGKAIFINGVPARMKGTVMDVTMRHDMLKRLERSERLHKQAQALTHIGNWSWSLIDNKVEWSDEMYRIYGLEPQSEEITVARFLEYVHPEDREKRREEIERALATNRAEDYTMRIVNDDGTIKYLQGRGEVMTDEHDKPYKLVGTCQDVTKQTLLYEQLRENEESSRELINNAPEAIIVIDPDSHILLWNPKAEETFGWMADEIIGKTVVETIIPTQYREQHPAGISRLEATGASTVINRTVEITALRKSGEEFYISLSISKSVRAGKNVFIAFIRDISSEKGAELQLAEQRNQLAIKNRELERSNQELMAFNYIASHDLQEPVRKIKIFSNLILEKGDPSLNPNIKDSITRINSSATRMQKLIEALIAFSRTTTEEQITEPVSLEYILNNTKNVLKEVIEERSAVITANDLPVLDVIPFQFQQLFENIIGNALKYSRKDVRPEITIATESVAGADIPDPEAEATTKYCHISIADNGIGFDQQYATKIFELFQRLHNKNEYSGTGIGLAICKKIAENHDGFITAQSKVGEGTRFNIYIPILR